MRWESRLAALEEIVAQEVEAEDRWAAWRDQNNYQKEKLPVSAGGLCHEFLIIDKWWTLSAIKNSEQGTS